MENKKKTISIFLIFFVVALCVTLGLNALAHFLPKGEDNGADDGKTDKMAVTIASMQNNVFEVQGEGGVGTGFIVSKTDGGVIAVTCYHVSRADSALLSVKMRGDNAFREGIATVIGYDSAYDITVMKISGNYDCVDLIKEGRMQGEFVAGEKIALLGNSDAKGIAAFDGIIGMSQAVIKCEDANHTNLHLKYMPVVHVTAAVNAGCSGCPVFDEDGNIVGMGFYQMFADGDRPLFDMGFALPVKLITAVVNQAVENGGRIDRLASKLSVSSEQQADKLIVRTLVNFEEIGLCLEVSTISGKIVVVGGEHDGKQVAEIGGVAVSGVDQLCSNMLNYSVNGRYDALTVRFTDGSTAEFEARKTLF